MPVATDEAAPVVSTDVPVVTIDVASSESGEVAAAVDETAPAKEDESVTVPAETSTAVPAMYPVSGDKNPPQEVISSEGGANATMDKETRVGGTAISVESPAESMGPEAEAKVAADKSMLMIESMQKHNENTPDGIGIMDPKEETEAQRQAIGAAVMRLMQTREQPVEDSYEIDRIEREFAAEEAKKPKDYLQQAGVGSSVTTMLTAGYVLDINRDIEFDIMKIEDALAPPASAVQQAVGDAPKLVAEAADGIDAIKEAMGSEGLRNHPVATARTLLDDVRADLEADASPAELRNYEEAKDLLQSATGSSMDIETVSLLTRAMKKCRRNYLFIKVQILCAVGMLEMIGELSPVIEANGLSSPRLR